MIKQIALEVYREGDDSEAIESKVRTVLQNTFGPEADFGSLAILIILFEIFMAILPILIKLLLL